MPTSLNYKDLYQAIDQLRRENNEGQAQIANKLESFIKEEYTPLRDKVNQMWIWGSISVGIASLLTNMFIPMVVKAFLGK